MSLIFDRKRQRVLVQFRRVDHKFGTGMTYKTSVSIDQELMDFFMLMLDGDFSRFSQWLEANLEALEAEAAKCRDSATVGFSRVVQRAMLRELRRHCTVKPMKVSGAGEGGRSKVSRRARRAASLRG